ncbi:hypothetical protein AMS68_007158 [Peltaster fructicola]|uniref:Telomeric single stranded DNA binding POT1/Cdc13 domain-containing protein n=1 Tax=Peltaster fructicola TaxID=286661 RepID=A0A6H0Y3Z3_9PEZI|nr:hypothetical protein AMS68_007158 [Peltaster fructicola]
MSREIPISALQPSSLTSDTSIRGVIKLIWPYSQSSQTYAVLLAALDSRQRSQQGQVRITFSGGAANAVVKSNVGISDTLVVNLKSAIWHEGGDVKTPGRSVDGELEFKNAVDLSVINADGSTRDISLCASTLDREAYGSQHITPLTPARLAPVALQSFDSSSVRKDSFESPAFLKRAHINVDLTADPFLEANDDEALQKRARTSFGTVRDWRYVGRSPSPVNEDDGDMDLNSSTSRTQQALLVASTQNKTTAGKNTSDGLSSILRISSMQPPPLPQPLAISEVASLSEAPAPTTPKLHPVAASALPLPSPFPNEMMQSHFEGFGSLGNGEIAAGKGNEEQLNLKRDQSKAVLQSQDDSSMLALEDHPVSTPSHLPTEAQSSSPSKTSNVSQYGQAEDATAASEHSDTATPVTAAASQGLDEREQTRKQMLSSLFGFQASPYVTDNPSTMPRSQSHGRTLSEFELAESQAMDRLMPPQDSSKVQDATGDSSVEQAIDKALEPFNHTKEMDTNHTLVQELRHESVLTPSPLHQSEPQYEAVLHTHQTQAHEGPSWEGDAPASLSALDMTQNGTATHTDLLSSTRRPHFNSNTFLTLRNEQNSQDSHTQTTMQNTTPTQVGLNGAPTQGTELTPRTRQQHTFPEGLRKWMSPRNQPHKSVVKDVSVTNFRALSTVEVDTAAPPRAGLQTSTSYYTALGRLRDYFNVPGSRVDVIAMITSGLVTAGRVELEPLDFFLSFEIKDVPLPETAATRVTLYRQDSASLPKVAPGDVILLRAMSVRSRRHQAVLVSNDESAWVVWRFSELYSRPGGMAPDGKENQPSDRELPVDADVREEILGPPIEYGEEERREVKLLKNSMLSEGELPAAFNGSRPAGEMLQEREVPRRSHED